MASLASSSQDYSEKQLVASLPFLQQTQIIEAPQGALLCSRGTDKYKNVATAITTPGLDPSWALVFCEVRIPVSLVIPAATACLERRLAAVPHLVMAETRFQKQALLPLCYSPSEILDMSSLATSLRNKMCAKKLGVPKALVR